MKIKYSKKIEYHVDQFGMMECRFKNPKIITELNEDELESDESIVTIIAIACANFYKAQALTAKLSPVEEKQQ